MKKKFTQFRWLVTMILFVTAMAMPKMAWAQISPKQPSSGDGKSANPYQIGTAAELYWFAALVNGTLTDGTSKNPSACAVLVSNITVNTDLLNSLDENGDPKDNLTVQSWTPIGYYKSNSDYVYYKGTFDGNGYSISGLYVKDTDQSYVSFIGDIEKGCVKNIAILDSYFEGSMIIGGIVGYLNGGIINNCLFSGTVKSKDKVGGICGGIQGFSTISDCFSNAKILVDNADNYCGGICGHNKGEINNCTNGGTVIGNSTGSGAGGVCGMNYGTVKDCKNTGSVSGTVSKIGGVCGAFYSGTIENCLNEGTVSGTGETSKSAYGGVCGHAYGGVIKLSSNTASVSGNNAVGGVCGYNQGATLEDCYNTGAVIGTGNASFGGVCGENSSGYTINCYNTGAVSGKNNVGGVCGQNYGTITNCYYLSGTATGGINGEDATGSAEGKTEAQFNSGEVTYLLNEGKAFGTQVWGQQLRTEVYPVLSSDYKVIRAAKGDKDANGDYPYWATFSNQSCDFDLGDLNVYTAKVSNGVLTITRCSDKIVAVNEGVLVKGSTEYLNAKMLNTTSADAEANNDLVATPDETQIIYADSGHKLYRLTYNSGTSELGFYWGLVKNDVGTVISDNGSQLKATPNKAYLKVSTEAATKPSNAAPARGFVFPGDDETTGIGEIVIEGDAGISGSANANGRIYNLQGQQVTAPVKGLYIKNNKKVIIK